MTREELIKIIYNSSSTASCPQAYNCNKAGKDNCWNCTEGLLTEYEEQLRMAAFAAGFKTAQDIAYEKLLAEVDEYEFYLPGRNSGRTCTQLVKDTIKFLISMVEEKENEREMETSSDNETN